MDSPHYKILLIGGRNTGKTVFLNRHLTGNFEYMYRRTKRNETKILNLKTTAWEVILEFIDTPGMGDEWKVAVSEADGVMLFSTTISISHRREISDKWLPGVLAINPDVAIVSLVNKCELSRNNYRRKVVHSGIQELQVSAKSNYNADKPFLILMRQLTGIEDLQYLSTPVIPIPLR